MFVAVHASMVSSGLIDGARIRIADVVLRKLHASECDQSGVRRTWIDEHIFFVPLTVDGIRVGTQMSPW